MAPGAAATLWKLYARVRCRCATRPSRGWTEWRELGPRPADKAAAREVLRAVMDERVARLEGTIAEFEADRRGSHRPTSLTSPRSTPVPASSATAATRPPWAASCFASWKRCGGTGRTSVVPIPRGTRFRSCQLLPMSTSTRMTGSESCPTNRRLRVAWLGGGRQRRRSREAGPSALGRSASTPRPATRRQNATIEAKLESTQAPVEKEVTSTFRENEVDDRSQSAPWRAFPRGTRLRSCHLPPISTIRRMTRLDSCPTRRRANRPR